MASAWVWPPTTGGEVSPCTELAIRLLIGHLEVVGLINSVQSQMHWGVDFIVCFLMFIHVCGIPGGVLLKRGTTSWHSLLGSCQWHKTWSVRYNRNHNLTTRYLSETTSNNLSYLVLNYITKSACATVSSNILSYTAIYGYTVLYRCSQTAWIQSDVLSSCQRQHYRCSSMLGM